MKNKSPKLIPAVLLLALLASCNTGNKVVSSFGKRKYTKGYFFNSSGHGKTELPLTAVAKTPEVNNKTSYTANNKAIPLGVAASAISPTRQKKLNPINIPKTIIGKIQHVLIKNTTQNISLYSQSSSTYGVPGHESTTTTNGSDYDPVATVSLICGLTAFTCLVLLYVGVSSAIFDGLIPLAVIVGFICGIVGLKGIKNHAQALAGLIICSAIIGVALVAIAFIIAFI